MSDGQPYSLVLWQIPPQKQDEGTGSADNGKALVFGVCVHYLFRYQSDHTQELTLDWPLPCPLQQFRGRSSYGGGGNSTLPNIPIGISNLVLSLGFLDSIGEAICKAISDYAKDLVSHPVNAALKLIRIRVRIEIIAFQQDGEPVDYTMTRVKDNALNMIRSYISNYNKEKYLTRIDQALLHKNTISKDPPSCASEEDCCSICLQKLFSSGDGGSSSHLPCSHVYHYDCIVKWLWRSNSCPLCRTAYFRF